MKHFLAVPVVAALTGLSPATAAGQAAPPGPALQAQPGEQAVASDARWLPWLGCWRPADERAPEQGVLVCVVPAGANGARVMTLAGDHAVIDETFVADGVSRPVDEPGCRGSRTSHWSKGGRLFAVAELACEGQPARKVSGLSFIAPDSQWIDIQAVTTGNRETVRVRRYRRTSEQPPDGSLLPPEIAARAAQSADGAHAQPFTLGDVIEASGAVSAAAIEAAVVETQAVFPVSSRMLIALDDAGVADNVIDLMVAQAFPKQFQVRRRGGGSSSGSWADYGGVGWDWYGYDPFYSYYSPFGYNYWHQFGDYYYYGYGGGAVIDPGGGGAPAGSDAHGRVVNGSGYTQVSPVNTSANTRGRPTGDSTSSDSGGSSGGSSSGGGSGGSVSSGGYSGDGGDSGRSAVPR